METTQTTLERTLTQKDYVRLTRLLVEHGPGLAGAEAMQDVLDGSELVASPAVPPTVVTMYSQVLLQDPAGTAPPYKMAICYPGDAEPSNGFVSVLSPVGMALLGLRVGEIARWKTPTGASGAAKIVEVLFQPEASGDYET
ncbi:MAG: GreA/GreB family elongation factor [Ramlibacter sp.]